MKPNPRILLVDDDTELCELLAEYLTDEGFTVTAVNDGLQGTERAVGEAWDAVVLDVMLPGMNGFDILRQLKHHSPATPVLMLTARGEDTDTVVGLELGADDYVAKPCNPRVLVARLRALLRRTAETAPAIYRVGDLELDPAQRRVTLGDRPVELTGAEFNLLALLVKDAGHIVSRDVLAEEGLGRALQAFDRRIETHMAQIRRKLGPLPDGNPRIQTVRGAGYQYVLS
jgi:two-component system response regulator CpxR